MASGSQGCGGKKAGGANLKGTFQNNYDFSVPSLYGQNLDKEGMILGTNTKDVKKRVIIMRRAGMFKVGCLTVLLGTFLVLLPAGHGLAAITGACVNCHTMHNSQNGGTVTSDGNTHGYLLLASCIGCHTGSFSSTTIPKVDKTTNILAGGSFKTTIADAKAKRHDVIDITDFSTGDDSYGVNGTPGNSESDLTVTPTELRCAGAKGCHGRHDAASTTSDKGIKGFHHAAPAVSGYRFLWIGTSATAGTVVLGKKSSDYEATVSSSNHNVYSADATAGISKYCAECHGVFHGTGNTGSSSPFTRHPTDRRLGTGGASWTWASFNWAAQTAPYDNTPVAFTNMSGIETNTAYFGTDNGSIAAVMCLSCHRAHGSANDDILRWSYDSSAGGASKEKCLACHYNQR